MDSTKRIVYDYLLNYFGGGTYEGKVCAGASIGMNIRAYKGGEEVLFEDGKEPRAKGFYLFNVFDISFSREGGFKVERNLHIDNLFRLMFGWDSIKYEIVSYALDVFTGIVRDIETLKDIPEEIKNLPVQEPVYVTKVQFHGFLSAHKDDFDISDNKRTQVTSVKFVDCSR